MPLLPPFPITRARYTGINYILATKGKKGCGWDRERERDRERGDGEERWINGEYVGHGGGRNKREKLGAEGARKTAGDTLWIYEAHPWWSMMKLECLKGVSSSFAIDISRWWKRRVFETKGIWKISLWETSGIGTFWNLVFPTHVAHWESVPQVKTRLKCHAAESSLVKKLWQRF